MTRYTESFASWAELIDAIRAEYRIAYQAPMDFRPVSVTATIRKDGKVRVSPAYSDADPFTADAGHLSRFRREPRNASR